LYFLLHFGFFGPTSPRANEMAVGCRCLLVKLNEYLKSQQTNGFRTTKKIRNKSISTKTPGENGTFVPRRHLALQKIFFH